MYILTLSFHCVLSEVNMDAFALHIQLEKHSKRADLQKGSSLPPYLILQKSSGSRW